MVIVMSESPFSRQSQGSALIIGSRRAVYCDYLRTMGLEAINLEIVRQLVITYMYPVMHVICRAFETAHGWNRVIKIYEVFFILIIAEHNPVAKYNKNMPITTCLRHYLS